MMIIRNKHYENEDKKVFKSYIIIQITKYKYFNDLGVLYCYFHAVIIVVILSSFLGYILLSACLLKILFLSD